MFEVKHIFLKLIPFFGEIENRYIIKREAPLNLLANPLMFKVSIQCKQLQEIRQTIIIYKSQEYQLIRVFSN